MRAARWVLAAFLTVTAAGDASAAVVTLNPTKDNTLYEACSPPCTPDGGSNGSGVYLFAGETFSFGTRRAVLAFDVAGSVPAGATILSATLTLHGSTPGSTGSVSSTIHRLTSDWGEGASDAGSPGGGGVGPATGDASWDLTFAPSANWTTAGGDFAATASATQTVDASTAFFTWGSTTTMVSDVQGWLDTPSTSYGWIVRVDETTAGGAKRFDSRENTTASLRPELTVQYLAAAPAMPAWGPGLVAALLLIVATLALRARRPAAS